MDENDVAQDPIQEAEAEAEDVETCQESYDGEPWEGEEEEEEDDEDHTLLYVPPKRAVPQQSPVDTAETQAMPEAEVTFPKDRAIC